MKFTKIHSLGTIIIVLLSLSGLGFIQMNWLQGAKVIQEEKLKERTDKAYELVKNTFENKFYRIKPCQGVSSIKKEEMKIFVKQVIDSVLREAKLDLPFEYGITTCNSNEFRWFSNPILEEDISKACNAKLNNFQVLSMAGIDHFHIYTLFTKKEQLIFSAMSIAIGSSILFILLLIAAFSYLLFTIFQQKKLSNMKTDFINNLTHEFKTPIASIALAAKTMNKLETVNQSKKAQSYIQLIHQEGKRLENHIDKVLQMATYDAGTFELNQEIMDINPLIEKVKDSFSVILEQKSGTINLDLMSNKAKILGDPMHLFNIIYNIIDNGIKYNDAQPHLNIKSELDDKWLKISVADNGIGMNKEVQNQIFDRFYRQRNGDIHDVKGFGLGLTYVRRMMEAHHGTIELESKKGLGTTFILYFPLWSGRL